MIVRFRVLFLLAFLVVAALLGFGLYLQHVKHLEPCPLCIFQRYAFAGAGVIALLAGLHNPKRWGRAIYGVLLFLFSALGFGIAARQVWLQHLPADKVPECGPGLEFMLDAFPLTKALPMIFAGSGECAKVEWTFLGLSIAEWSLGWFVAFALLGLYAVVRRRSL